jgi:hypothetical protein
MTKTLDQVATADLTKAQTVQQMAEAEGWTADLYALALSERIRTTREPLDSQRERLAALCTVGAGLTGDQAAAAELARHEALLTAIFQRFIHTAAELAEANPLRNAKAVEAYMHSALKAHRAALMALSAIKSIRESQRAPDL